MIYRATDELLTAITAHTNLKSYPDLRVYTSTNEAGIYVIDNQMTKQNKYAFTLKVYIICVDFQKKLVKLINRKYTMITIELPDNFDYSIFDKAERL